MPRPPLAVQHERGPRPKRGATELLLSRAVALRHVKTTQSCQGACRTHCLLGRQSHHQKNHLHSHRRYYCHRHRHRHHNYHHHHHHRQYYYHHHRLPTAAPLTPRQPNAAAFQQAEGEAPGKVSSAGVIAALRGIAEADTLAQQSRTKPGAQGGGAEFHAGGAGEEPFVASWS